MGAEKHIGYVESESGSAGGFVGLVVVAFDGEDVVGDSDDGEAMGCLGGL